MASILTCTFDSFDFFAAFPVPTDIIMDAEEGAAFLLLAGGGDDSVRGGRGGGGALLLLWIEQFPAAGDDSAVGRDIILLPSLHQVPAEGDDNIG
jgi:hypothetical protein